MHEGLIIFNELNKIEAANVAAVDMLGWPAEAELYGRSVKEIFNSSSAAEAFLVKLNAQHHIDSCEDIFVRLSGQTLVTLYSAMIISESAGSERLGVIMFQDITSRKRAEQQLAAYSSKLEKKNRELDHFAYVVSHDLKAPLRAISNLSTWLQEDLESHLTDDSKKNFELLRGRVSRLEALINGVLEYSKIGRTEITPEVIDTPELITDIIDLLPVPQHIRFEIGNDLPKVYGPRILLTHVFSNLISNAIKYNDKPEGLIRIYATERERHYEFVVEDNGPGIDKEYQEKIFQIFQTLQSRDKFESTGVGLAIVKRIIDEQDGRIWVESEAGKGSKFIFTWPVNEHTN